MAPGIAALVLFLAAVSPALCAASDWEIINRDGRDFVSVDNVVRFYGLAGESFRTKAFRGPLGTTQFVMLSEDGREIQLNGARHWLCFPIVQDGDRTLISRMDLVKTIEPVLRPRAIRGLQAFTTVVIDAGHGGHDRGAPSRFGYEKNYTLDVAKRLAPVLRAAGLKTVLTRTRDEFIPLMTRAAIANKTPDSIFVSIHFNSTSTRSTAEGVEVFALAPQGAPSTADAKLGLSDLKAERGNVFDSQSMALATAIHRSLLKRGGQVDRGVKRARFTVLAATERPSVLLECAFLSNSTEARYVASSAWRQRLAQAIAAGVIAYRSIAESSSTQPTTRGTSGLSQASSSPVTVRLPDEVTGSLTPDSPSVP